MPEDAINEQTAAMVALLRSGGRAWARFVLQARNAGGASAVNPSATLEEELGLLAYEALADATDELTAWHEQGITVLTLRDPNYPANLAVTTARPPLLFVKGRLTEQDNRSIAVIGTRNPSDMARQTARELAIGLGKHHFTIVSGLAAGIDTEVHRTSLDVHGRTLAVIGTGHHHAYPKQNEELQEQIAESGAVISLFWPETEPTKQTFPARNAVMSALTLASIIVEASATSGTRIQARHALEQGRQLVLMSGVLVNDWAQELATRPGVHVAESPEDAVAALRT